MTAVAHKPLIAAVQTNSHGDLQSRLDRTADLCRQASERGAKLVVLPENFAYFGEKDTAGIADREATGKGVARQFLSDLARQYELWIVGGTLPLWDRSGKGGAPGKPPFASTLIYSDKGEELYRYDKIKLFDVSIPEQNFHYRESDTFTPGNGKTLVFNSPAGKVGVLVCFDLRFPRLALELANKGVEIIVAPSAFTRETGEKHWKLLLRARAIDTLSYVVGPNLAGRKRSKKATWGGSAIVDPWGEVLAEMGDEEGIITAVIDLERQKQIRARMPLLKKD